MRFIVEVIAIKLKGISNSQSKSKKFEEYKNCLDGNDYQQQCHNYIMRSNNREVYLQRVCKNSL